MPEALSLLRQGRTQELWNRCCGFLDMPLDQFMATQRRLLMEQVRLMAECELGAHLVRRGVPQSVQEFQEIVPLTTYADYAQFLLDRREDVLPEMPMYWQRTSGRSGQYRMKWVPVTERMYREQSNLFLAVLLLASCDERGQVRLAEHDKVLYGLAPKPYTSGFWSQSLVDEAIFDFLPPVEEAVKLDFQARFKRGFEMATEEGMDIFFGLASVLVAVGERFSGQADLSQAKGLIRQPRALLRMVRAALRAKMAGRALLPRDIWTLKALATGGGDTAIYRDKVKQMWGRYPLEVYGSTEANLVAVQTWDYEGMSFIPHTNLVEFLPLAEVARVAADATYQPRALLLDQVEPGELYEVILSSFLGGAFLRYRTGDLVRIISRRNERTNVNTPQMVFYSRVDNVLEIGGFTSLTENIIWKALENSGTPYQDWTVVRETKDRPSLHLYVELKIGVTRDVSAVAKGVHDELCKLDDDYAAVETMLGYVPLRLSLLPEGSFARFTAKQQAAGADLAWLKPPHVNPSEATLSSLLERTPAGG